MSGAAVICAAIRSVAQLALPINIRGNTIFDEFIIVIIFLIVIIIILGV